jgi:molecular chaperone GrpE
MKKDSKEEMAEQEVKVGEEPQEEVVNEAEEKAQDKATEEEAPEIELSREEQLEIELSEAKDKYLRLYSEFENFRRRNAKERIELIKTASSDLMTEFLPTVDDFDRAIEANGEQQDIEAIKEGFVLIRGKMLNTLEAKGLKLMETPKGTEFDAELHEAVTQFPAGDDLKGKIVDTVEKGYYLGDKVIRFAKVVIGA